MSLIKEYTRERGLNVVIGTYLFPIHERALIENDTHEAPGAPFAIRGPIVVPSCLFQNAHGGIWGHTTLHIL